MHFATFALQSLSREYCGKLAKLICDNSLNISFVLSVKYTCLVFGW